jgi:hypothetical protein
MKRILFVFAVAFAAFAMDAVAQPPKGRLPQRPQQQKVRPQQKRGLMAKRGAAKGARGLSRVDDRDDRHDRLGGPDRRLIDAIEEADSLHELRRHLQAAAISRSEDVRLAMVEALEEKGSRSASDLAYFIADPNEDVADAAFSAWTSVLDDARGDRRVRAILETAEILRGFSGGLWQAPGMVPPAPSATVPVMQPGTVPVPQPVAVPAVR